MVKTSDRFNSSDGQTRRQIILSAAAAAGMIATGERAAKAEDIITGSRLDYLSADASCLISFTSDRNSMNHLNTVPVIFPVAARGCGTIPDYDTALNKQVSKLDSVLTFFHADDNRPSWLSLVDRLTNRGDPQELPRPAGALARRLLQSYGPGSITVLQDPRRPVHGQVIAAEEGRNGKFFPAFSYFDQFLVVLVAGRALVNREPLRVSATVKSWPPQGEVYTSDNLTAFYDLHNIGGAPICQFGGCTIRIGSPVTEEIKTAMQEIIMSLLPRTP